MKSWQERSFSVFNNGELLYFVIKGSVSEVKGIFNIYGAKLEFGDEKYAKSSKHPSPNAVAVSLVVEGPNARRLDFVLGSTTEVDSLCACLEQIGNKDKVVEFLKDER